MGNQNFSSSAASESETLFGDTALLLVCAAVVAVSSDVNPEFPCPDNPKAGAEELIIFSTSSGNLGAKIRNISHIVIIMRKKNSFYAIIDLNNVPTLAFNRH